MLDSRERSGAASREDGAPPVRISNAATTERVLELLDGLDWPRARIADVGAGHGYFSFRLAERLAERERLDPRAHVFPCDLAPEHFACRELECRGLGPGGRLPFEDESLDAAVSIEVIEHVEDQFAFLRELARVVRPGGRVIVTTPNVLSLSSRLRNLAWGFPELFEPLPLDGADARLLTGHIHPIAPYYLALAALRAGLEAPTFHADRRKRSAAFWAVLLAPLLLGARAFQTARLRRKQPAVLAQNEGLLRALGSFPMLTSRTAILAARKPAPWRSPRRHE